MNTASVILRYLKIRNFQPFGDKEQTFIFRDSGVYRIKAINYDVEIPLWMSEEEAREYTSNGVGKSAIVRALTYAFYGKLPKKISRVDKLINKISGKNLYIEIEFQTQEGVFRLERFRNHEEFKGKNGLRLYKQPENGIWSENHIDDEISRSDVRETENYIAHLLGMAMDLFCKTTVIQMDGSKPFLDLNPQERGGIVESIFSYDIFSKYIVNLKERIRLAKQDVEFFESELSRQKATYYSLKTTVRDDIVDRRLKINNNNFQLKKIAFELNEITGSNNPVGEIIKEFRRVKDSIQQKNQLGEKKATHEQILHRLSNEDLPKTQEELKQLKGKSNKDLEVICEQCSGVANQSIIQNLKKENREKIKKFNESINTIKNEISQTKQVIGNIQAELEKHNQIIANTFLSKNIISGLSAKIQDNDSNPEAIIESIQKEQLMLEHENKILYNTESLWRRIKEYREHKYAAKKNKKELRESKNHKRVLEWLVSSLDLREENSIKRYMISFIVPALNSTLSQIMDIVFDNRLHISFDVGFNERITYNGYDYDYSEFSTGEAATFNLCITLAIFLLVRQNLRTSNALFMDEIFAFMDATHIHKVMKAIKSFFAGHAGIYIISNEIGIEQIIPTENTILLEKRNNSTKIMN